MRYFLVEALLMAPIIIVLALLTSGVLFVVLTAITAATVVKAIEGGK